MVRDWVLEEVGVLNKTQAAVRLLDAARGAAAASAAQDGMGCLAGAV